MKSLRLVLAAAAAALPAIASAAQPAGGPIECIYRGVPSADLVLFMADDEESKAKLEKSGAEDRMRERSQACVKDHHWSQHQGEAALTYAFARVNEDLGVADLGKWGLPPVILDEVMADLGPAKVAALVDSKPGGPSDEEMGMTMLRRMAAHHVPMAKDDSQMTKIGDALGRAIAGRELANRAALDFSRPAAAAAQ